MSSWMAEWCGWLTGHITYPEVIFCRLKRQKHIHQPFTTLCATITQIQYTFTSLNQHKKITRVSKKEKYKAQKSNIKWLYEWLRRPEEIKLMKTKTIIANKHTDKHAQSLLAHVFPIGITQNLLLQTMFQEFSVGKIRQLSWSTMNLGY